MSHVAGEDTPGTDPYEAVLYTGHAYGQTQPDRLYLMGTLHGLAPAWPDGCRVLEIGCGDGMNLITIAARTPGVTAVGIDRAARPLERGRRYAEALGLDVELRALDLLDAQELELGEFDYVVSHGVYAWVPPPVRDALLALAGRVLAPHGIAYVSYNALPGGHIRRAMRDLIRYHARCTQEPAERAQRARDVAGVVLRWEDRSDGYGLVLNHELKRVANLSDHSLVHDDLSEMWEPASISDFCEHAAQHGMRFVGDGDPSELRYDRYPDGMSEALDELAGDDVVARAQYADYISGRPFRQTLLCRAERTPLAGPIPALETFRLASTHRPDPLGDGYASPFDAACAALAERFPRTMSLAELAAALGMPAAELAPSMLNGFRSGLLELHTREPRHAREVPERPATWPLARLQAVEGPSIASLAGDTYGANDPFRQRVVALLDGRRDHAGLVDALLASVGAQLVVEVSGEPIEDPEPLREPFAQQLETVLQEMCDAGLLLRDDA